MKAPTVVILAAGQGTRMRSATPKMLHELCGRPLVRWPVEAAREAGAAKVVVVGGPDGELAGRLPDDVVLVSQDEPLGTGDALRAAAGELAGDEPVVVLPGDMPLIDGSTIRALLAEHARARVAATMATMELLDPAGYGRVVRGADGGVERIAETKTSGDASAEELEIREVNTGVFVFDADPLREALDELRADNAQGEYYLPDVVPAMRAAGRTVAAHAFAEGSTAPLMLGVNDRADLARVRGIVQQLIHGRHMEAGVTIVDPSSTLVDADVRIGADTVVEPATYLRGATRAGERCRLGPLTSVIDAALGDDVTVAHSYLAGCEVRDGAAIGPFAYLRPGTVIREGAKAGTFVEIKNSDIGAGAKVPHLSYMGDADVGEGSNIGAGTITANYDGRAKHRTRIGRNVHGGVDNALVAPVEVGDDAWTAAGSVITEDVPPGALGVGRARQRNVEGYDGRKQRE